VLCQVQHQKIKIQTHNTATEWQKLAIDHGLPLGNAYLDQNRLNCLRSKQELENLNALQPVRIQIPMRAK
jgi:hypothetical protein